MDFVFWFQLYTLVVSFFGFLKMFKQSDFQLADPGIQFGACILKFLAHSPIIYAAFWFIPALVAAS